MDMRYISSEPYRHVVDYHKYAIDFYKDYSMEELKYQDDLLYTIKITESNLRQLAKIVDQLDRETLLRRRYKTLDTAYNQYLTILSLIESQQEYEKYC